ncbi:predicted protein [Nematostella vectensis]|uniref:Uncharacterized protein n=1 Tax=Nematostella vectensis TaxID=45351 RepID=A7RMP2_NEMVE|nr:predicted protein [Nematostella vectensis]|eukprot:XP_001639444.1 predicted protein [Nematostella vectensis]
MLQHKRAAKWFLAFTLMTCIVMFLMYSEFRETESKYLNYWKTENRFEALKYARVESAKQTAITGEQPQPYLPRKRNADWKTTWFQENLVFKNQVLRKPSQNSRRQYKVLKFTKKRGTRTKIQEKITDTRLDDFDLKLEGYGVKRSLYSSCGGQWLHRHTRLQNRITSGREKKRYLVYSCPGEGHGCFGYGNRIRAVIALFYLAVLTDRAFLIDWTTPEPLEKHLMPRGLQWNYTKPLECRENETQGIRRHYWGTHKLAEKQKNGWHIEHSEGFTKWFTRTDFDKYFEFPVEAVNTIWYFAEKNIPKNKYLMKRARELGVKPLIQPDATYASLFGCAFHFLFKKSPIIEHYTQKMAGKMRSTGYPVIGMHIRTGDTAFANQSVPNNKGVLGFLKCAERFERNLGPKVFGKTKLFLATDSGFVREFAKQRYQAKVLSTNLTIEHLDKTIAKKLSKKHVANHKPSAATSYKLRAMVVATRGQLSSKSSMNCTKSKTKSPVHASIHTISGVSEGIVSMLVDQFLLAECDYLIICDSSFSYSAVAMSMRNKSAFAFGDEDCSSFEQMNSKTKLKNFY